MTVNTTKILSAIATSALASGVLFSVSAPMVLAQGAQWGGTSEYGGGRQTVSFGKNYRRGQIVVSFADRRLYLVTKPGEALSYPIAVPKEDARWEGRTTVSMKRKNPAWRPTQNMLRKNPRLPSWVPGGHPMNPLGVRALYLGTSAYRIHGTDAPWTIGTAASSGCIRMFNKDVLDLYPRVPVGSSVQVTWKSYRSKQRYTSYEQKPQRSNRRKSHRRRF
ncbi:MAG: L,D-transpeptidase [Pseudomonadota bacterium]